MTYENIKTIILTILVITSVLLTWNLWTYQPNYETLEKANVVEEVSLSAKKDTKDIIKPDKVIFHRDGHYYGTSDQEKLENIIDDISRWNYDNFENLTSDIENISTLAEKNNIAEILYPGSIPISLYKNIISIKDKNHSDFSFDQIIINTDAEQKGNTILYFVSRQHKEVYQCTVSASYITNFNNKFFNEAASDREYFPFVTATDRTVFLPINETKLAAYQYLSKTLESDKFKNALFSDPSFVQKNYITTGEEYTDGSSLMRENTDTNMIYYIDPAEGNSHSENESSLLEKSIDFVNEHGGWTDNYHYVGMGDNDQTVLFRLYDSAGYPTFSADSNPISEVSLVWGESDINRYTRNNFTLGLLTSSEEIILPSGEAALAAIKQMAGYNPDLLENMTIGYTVKKDGQSLLVRLDPCWYYYYNGQWQTIMQGQLGGGNNGLE